MITRLGRDKDDGSVRNKLQAFGDNAAIGFGAFNLFIRVRKFAFTLGTSLFLGEIPLVDNDYHPFCLLVNLTGNMRILCRQALAGINEQ